MVGLPHAGNKLPSGSRLFVLINNNISKKKPKRRDTKTQSRILPICFIVRDLGLNFINAQTFLTRHLQVLNGVLLQ
jgi:hypothetical protein